MGKASATGGSGGDDGGGSDAGGRGGPGGGGPGGGGPAGGGPGGDGPEGGDAGGGGGGAAGEGRARGAARAQFPLAGAVVHAFVHSTEDAERVRGCVRAVVGPEAALDESASRGYHRQPLKVIEVDVRERAALRRILDLLRADPALREDYRITWERRLDAEEGSVHFRLAKQPLLEGRVVLEPPDGEGDVVKLELRLQAYPASARRYREIAECLLG